MMYKDIINLLNEIGFPCSIKILVTNANCEILSIIKKIINKIYDYNYHYKVNSK